LSLPERSYLMPARALAALLLSGAAAVGCAASQPPAPADQPPGAGPEHGPPGQGGQPPQEAIDACKGKAAKDACSVKMGDRTLDGTCESRTSEEKLACRPKGPPGGPGGPGGPPPGPPPGR